MSQNYLIGKPKINILFGFFGQKQTTMMIYKI